MRGSYRLFVHTMLAMVLIGGSSALAGIIAPVSRSSSLTLEEHFFPLVGPDTIVFTKQDSITGFDVYDRYISREKYGTDASHAYQYSSVLEDGIVAVHDVWGTLEGISHSYHLADSKLEFVFDVTTAASYRFMGSLAVWSEVPDTAVDEYLNAFGSMSLKGPGVNVDYTGKRSKGLYYQGTLEPGTYTLTMQSHTQEHFGADVTLSGRLLLTPLGGSPSVPEPASLSILGIGCALLVRRAR